MDRELLMALGALLIIVILIDGVRRVRNSRHDRIRVSRRKQPVFDYSSHKHLDEFGSELPNGGARVVDVRDDEDAKQLHGKIRQAAEEKKPKLAFAREEAKQLAPDLDDSEQTKGIAPDNEDTVEIEPVDSVKQDVAEEQPTDKQPAEEKSVKKQSAKKQPQQVSLELDQPKKTADNQASQEVIAFHLRAAKGKPFNGQSLLETLVEEGMRYGAMEMFHRHVESDGSGDVLFSIANSVEPGTFDLNTMGQATTPGISFFIDLGAVDNPSDAFGIMLNTIAGCMEQLGGELKDETRSTVTKQAIEHYWQRVRDFERRALSESV